MPVLRVLIRALVGAALIAAAGAVGPGSVKAAVTVPAVQQVSDKTPQSSHGTAHQTPMAVGHRMKATFTSQPPKLTAAQAASMKAAAARGSGRPATIGGFAKGDGTPPPNPPITPKSRPVAGPTAKAAASGWYLSLGRDTAINGLNPSYESSTMEPSTDADGSNIFETGNWFAAVSTNSGGNWKFLNLASEFNNAGFPCCDQVTQLDPASGHEFWLVQYTDGHLILANAAATGSNPYSNWCWVSFNPSSFGLPSSYQFDYEDMTITSSSVYITSNIYSSSTSLYGAEIIRFPKAALSTCGTYNATWIIRTDNATFKLAAEPTLPNAVYWASDTGQTNGSSFRVFSWPEGSSTYTWWTFTIPSFLYETPNGGQNCADASGLTANWCQRADSRVLGGYLSLPYLGFSFNAKQDANHPVPYTRVVIFTTSSPSTMSFLGYTDIFDSRIAIQYMSLAPNLNGIVGGEFTWSDTQSPSFYPSMGFLAAPPAAISLAQSYLTTSGQGNPCATGGVYRWGDYLTIRAYQSNPNDWIAAGYNMQGGNCGASGAFAQPHNYLLGTVAA